GLVTLNAELGRDEVADGWLEFGRERGHSLTWARFYVDLFYRDDVERAGEALDEMAEEEEEGYRIARLRAALALYEEDWTEARRQYRLLYPGVGRASIPLFGAFLWDPLGLAYALDRLGEGEEAREIAREVIRTTERELPADPDHLPRHRMAVAHLILGDTAAALDWLEEAVDVGYRDVRLVRTIPVLDPLRGHPRFQALLERMEILLAEERRRIEAEGWGLPPE
ncbi:MAG TPA: tetratricopeptide repeat protein, partial [Longimicrobiales bacterium]|nr:tetratricopeptide repeat protein [Longimicrobiales bacterium]